jgi:hypothetical protein
MTPASERIWALVSGLPRQKREARRIMVLQYQSFADDSGSEPGHPIFVLGGLVAPVAQWAAFSDDWQAALDAPIKLEYFKMTEAVHLGGQFHKRRGWTKPLAEAKVAELVEIIRRHVSYSMHVWLNNADFDRYMKHIPMPGRGLATDTPYLLLYTQYVLNTWNLQRDFGATSTVDFVFDEQQGQQEEADHWWPILKQIGIDNGLEAQIADKPIFRNEKRFLPLQGADLFAWEQRLHYVRNRRLIAPFTPTLQRLRSIRTVSTFVDEPAFEVLRNAALQMVGDHLKQFPQARLVGPGKQSRKKFGPKIPKRPKG